MPAWVAPVAAAGISGAASLLGANKSSKSADKAARLQTNFSEKALAEQRRIFDLQYEQEQRDREARKRAFAEYGNTQKPMRGPGPNPYGMSDAQALQMRNSFGQPSGVPRPMSIQEQLAAQPAQMQNGSPQPRSLKPTVWLQSPTGEVMEVDLGQAPLLMQRGAVIVPGPTGQMGR